MYEDIFASVALDESKAFIVVEPLDCTNLGHFNLRPGSRSVGRMNRAGAEFCNVHALRFPAHQISARFIPMR
jgi:hypothetical protein